MSLLSDLSRLSKLNIYDPTQGDPSTAQVAHRVELLKAWDVELEGKSVFEVGCGQGDATAVLAAAVGESGTVVGCDPASLDYGAPWTLGQAQDYLNKTEVGDRISWLQADPVEYLETRPEVMFDYGVLIHSLYYFASPTQLIRTLQTLAAHSRHGILLAEWGLTSSNPSSLPHLLAVLTQSSLEAKTPLNEGEASNVRTVLSPSRIKELLTMMEKPLSLVREGRVTPGNDLQDGGWEVGWVISRKWEERVDELLGAGKDERDKASVLAMRDTVRSAVESVGGVKAVTTMDVWVAHFVL